MVSFAASRKPRRYALNARLAKNPGAQVMLEKMGRELRLARLTKGWTRAQLATAVGVSWQCIAHVDSGRNFPSFPVYGAICDVLGLPKPPLT